MKRKLTLISVATCILVILIVLEIAVLRAGAGIKGETAVLCAATGLSEGMRIEQGMLVQKSLPDDLIYDRMLRGNSEDYVGMFVSGKINAGEMLSEDDITAADSMTDRRLKDSNNVLFALDLKGDQAGSLLLAEDCMVDLIIVYNGDKKPPERIMDVRVAAVYDEYGNCIQKTENSGNAAVSRYVILEVSVEQAIMLAVAENSGKVKTVVKGRSAYTDVVKVS